jgi:hypothetical protein
LTVGVLAAVSLACSILLLNLHWYKTSSSGRDGTGTVLLKMDSMLEELNIQILYIEQKKVKIH